MRFEWDEKKRKRNIRRHGIDFVAARVIFAGQTVTFLDDRYNYEEERLFTLGLLWGRPVVVVHTEANGMTRIISIRKATKNEEKIYFEEFSDWRN